MIRKTIFCAILTTFFFISCSENKGEYDTRAIESLDKLSETIGGLSACSYTLNTIISKHDGNIDKENDVYMKAPDKMYIHTTGTKGEKSFWYNGSKFAYYLYDKNVYDTIPASGNILEVIDVLHEKYTIDFPAADFFYPSLTDDIIEDFDSVLYVGDEVIDGVSCTAIEASNDEQTLQIWIARETNLPHRMVIASKTDDTDFYDVVFSNWKINQELPDLLFEFEPPADSERVQLTKKN